MSMRLAAMLAIALATGGCAAYTVVDTAVGAASTVAGTAVDVGAGAIDLAVPDRDDDDDDD